MDQSPHEQTTYDYIVVGVGSAGATLAARLSENPMTSILLLDAVGTYRMGAADDPFAVVDPEGRVRGVEGLRVVDASIMPEPPRANTHLTTVMLAEYLAERMSRATPENTPATRPHADAR